jgi:hypothetical protein
MRLETAGLRGSGLFSPEAVELIAACSKRIPRLVNHICDKALFHAFAASKSRISADIVKEVVRALKLVEEPKRIEETGVSELRRAVGEDIFRPTRQHGPVIAQDPNSPREQFDYFVWTDSDAEGWLADPGKRKHPRLLAVGFWLLLLMTAGGAALLYSRGVTVPFLRGQAEQLADSGQAGGRMPEANPTPAPAPPKVETGSNTNVPSTEVIPPSEEPVKADSAPLPEDKTHAEDFSKSAFESAPEPVPEKTREKRRGTKNQVGIEQARGDEKSVTRELTIKIHRAIHNRAIRGVDVHVRGGTVYLGGQVATHRQRHAAIRATRSVPGVKEVRDQIAVDRTVDSNRRG